MYDNSLKRKWDNHGALTYARQEGRDEERVKSEADKRAIALRFKHMGLSNADIAKGTGLSIEEIERLK